jgi:hypothetical protein
MLWPGDVNRRSWLALALGCGLLLAGCRPAAPPALPGLATEDFGSGIKLLSSGDDARAAGDAAGRIRLQCLNAVDLAQAQPYSSDAQQDLVVAVTGKPPAQAPGAPDDCVIELRCYIAVSPDSRATLLGHPLSGMQPEDAEQFLGKPQTVTNAPDATHLEYAFSDPGQPNLKLGLMLSFRPAPIGCFAARLHLISPPPKF